MSDSPLPRVRRLGLIWPGLGHLLDGDRVEGVGLMTHTLILVWAGVAGFPRLKPMLFPEMGTPELHPWVALVSWFALLGALGSVAWRYATRPPPQRRSQSQELSRQFRRNRAAVGGLHCAIALMLLALLTPMIAPFDPISIDAGVKLGAPNAVHIMGTDNFGRDVFSRVLYGARISLSIGFVAVALSATLGTLVGAVAGYFGGAIDRALMWVVDLLISLPRLVLLLAIVGLFRQTGAAAIFLIVVILGLTGWMGVSRIVRSSVLSLKEQDFVQACRALGLPDRRIIFVHIVPNALAPVIVHASLAIGGTILTEAALSFLGLGVPPPTSTWGALIDEGRQFTRSAPWISVFPGLFIVAAVMSFNLIGDGLRDALDPRLRGRQ